MAIAEDASTPAVVKVNNSTSASTATTASFIPPANSMVVVLGGIVIADQPSSATSLSVSDSLSTSWTAGPTKSQASSADFMDATVSIWTHYFTSSPGAMTVTVTSGKAGTASNAIDIMLAVRVLTGAASTQTGAGSVSAAGPLGFTSTAIHENITVDATGSWVYFIAGENEDGTQTVVSGTQTITTLDDTSNLQLLALGRQSSSTGTTATGSTSYGWTTSAQCDFVFAGLEILAGSGSTTQNGTVTASATAAASFGGTKTALPALTPAVTAQAAFRGVHPGHLTTTATAHTAFTRTRVQLRSLTAAATAQASFRAVHPGHLTPGITAAAAFAGTKIGAGSGALTASVTAQGVFRAVHPGHLTSAATAHAVFARTRITLRTLSPAVTASAVLAGTKTGLGSLISSVTAVMGATGHGPNVVRTPLNFTGAIVVHAEDSQPTDDIFGGTVTQADSGGGATLTTLSGSMSETPNPLGGTISETDQGGSINLADLGGSAVGWTMQNVNLNFAEFNDITLSVTITSNGSPLDLTSYTVKMLLKPSAGIADTDPNVITLSSAGGSPAITITSAVNGQCSVAITHTDVQNQSLGFYRIDAVDGSGNINTAIYGNITYTAL